MKGRLSETPMRDIDGCDVFDPEHDAAVQADMCPSTREAIEEMEELGEVGCPLCGLPAADHPKDWWDFS